LNDTVAQITGTHIRETIPDRILDRAAEIELVDLSPEELLQRLREGKVYVPEEAERAMRRFFRLGNLTALRELALRHRLQAEVEESVFRSGGLTVDLARRLKCGSESQKIWRGVQLWKDTPCIGEVWRMQGYSRRRTRSSGKKAPRFANGESVRSDFRREPMAHRPGSTPQSRGN